MSIKFFQDETLTTVVDFSLKDFFNPIKNKTFKLSLNNTNNNILQANTFLKCIKQLYTREFLQKYFLALNYGLKDFINKDDPKITEFLSFIPDEDLYLLYFTHFTNYSSRSGFNVCIYTVGTTGSHYIYNIDSNLVSTQINQEQINTFLTRLKRNVHHYNSAFDTIKKFRPLSYDFAYSSPFKQCFEHFITNCSNFRTDEGSTHPSDIEEPFEIHFNSSNNTSCSETDIQNGKAFYLFITEPFNPNSRKKFYKILNYSTDVTKLFPEGFWPKKEKGEQNPVTYGIELECATDYTVKELIDAQHEMFMIGKSDGSISGHGNTKVELVTLPMSMKSHKKHWAHFFKNIDYTKFDTSKETSNGCHIHIGRKHFENKNHIRNFTWFLSQPANTDFIVFVSQRGSLQAMSSYTPIVQYNSSRVSSFKNCERLQGS